MDVAITDNIFFTLSPDDLDVGYRSFKSVSFAGFKSTLSVVNTVDRGELNARVEFAFIHFLAAI